MTRGGCHFAFLRLQLPFPFLHPAFQIENGEQEKSCAEGIGELLGVKLPPGQGNQYFLQKVKQASGHKGDQKSVHTGERQ